MAAASAGAVQPGSAVSSGNVEQQMVTVLQQQQQQQQQHRLQSTHQQHHQQSHVVQHHQQLQHNRQLLHQQQQIRPQHHHNVQYQTAAHHQQRHPIIPRAGNGSQPQLRHAMANSAIVSNIAEQQQQQSITNNQQQQQQQHTLVPNVAKQLNTMLHGQPQTTIAANLAPGWRRLLSNNEIIYVSPSGATLRSHSQIKDYLLSPNTCKCGLPCPLRPEYFFEFNSQVPNMLLQIPLENGAPARSSLVCSHQRKYFESQQDIMHKEIKRRKLGESSASGKMSTSPVPQVNSVTVYSGNVMQTSQLVTANNPTTRMQVMAGQTASTSLSYQQKQQPSAAVAAGNEKQIGSVTLSKTPPWRKNSILQQQQQPLSQPGQPQIYSDNERIPPLPQAHLQQAQNLVPPWQQQEQQELMPNRIAKSRQSPSKKKPNFKDDPTGYLDQQTAILHSSILNVVSNPDETPPLEDGDYSQSDNKDDNVEDDALIRNQHSMSVIQQQNQNVYPRSHNHQLIDPKLSQLGIKQQQPQPQFQSVSSNFIYNQNQPRMTAPSQMGSDKHQIQPVPSQQHVLSGNVPSSQQFLVDKSNEIRNPSRYLTDHDQQHATTTTIGGQTVTHFPNGMVQVEQNCDNSLISLKPQQQIQLQQQIQQHNMLYRQSQQIHKTTSSPSSVGKVMVNFPPSSLSSSSPSSVATTSEPKANVSHESPVSSSTAFNPATTPEHRQDNKGPPQVGAISTSNESPLACPSPVDSESTSSSSVKSSPSPAIVLTKSQSSIYGTSQTSARNTITSVQAGRTITATTTSSVIEKHASTAATESQSNNSRDFRYHSQKLSPNNLIPVSSTLSGLHLQPAMREAGSQLIMTSTGQLLVMPTQGNKSTNQVIINSPTGNNLVHQQSVVINQQGVVNSVDVSNSTTTTNHIIQNSPNGGLVIQNTGLVQPSTNMIQSAGNLIGNNSQNFIVNSSNGIQSMILNNSNLIQQNGQNLNLIQNSNGSSLIATGPNGAKVISNNANILNQPNVIGNSSNLISPNGGNLIGQQTVVLNTLPNGYVIQPNFTTVDGQVVGQIVNQDGGSTSFMQQQSRQIILTSPDSKRKTKKRKSSSSLSPSTPTSLSPQQSPNLQQQQHSSSMVQITPQYSTQGFQISSGIQGIAVVNKNQQTAPQQQIIFQNGQILQPMNIIGQQLLVPAGLVMAPDTTLLQIQNIGPCGNLITPQGMVLRASSPQNKNFLSPGGPTGQQFIVSGNNHQMSPLGHIYGAPVSLVMPQSNSGAATTFVQQNPTILQQQAGTATIGGGNGTTSASSSNSSSSSNLDQGQNQGNASPPDTTTHSPRSPERPPSERSGGSDMVQCVSSSEPDSVVSPVAADSAQSPSTTDYDRSSNISYHSTTNIYKPSDAKIRRVETPPQYNTTIVQDTSNQMPPDSHESSSNSPAASSAISTTSSTASPPSMGNGTTIISSPICNGFQGQIPTSFSIGQLVWGTARGHPAWPGKIVNPPDGSCTPSDSTWVQWFGGRANSELVAIASLKTLSEGLEAHHKAQKDTRKSRKLNQQLERAIQEAMTELDRISAMAQPTSTTPQNMATAPTGKSKNRGRQPTSTVGHQRTKPIKIAPAPPCTTTTLVQQSTIRQHQSTIVQQQQQQQQQTVQRQQQHQTVQHQQQHPQSAAQTK